MRKFYLYSDKVISGYYIKCDLIKLPAYIIEFAMHYGLSYNDVKVV